MTAAGYTFVLHKLIIAQLAKKTFETFCFNGVTHNYGYVFRNALMGQLSINFNVYLFITGFFFSDFNVNKNKL